MVCLSALVFLRLVWILEKIGMIEALAVVVRVDGSVLWVRGERVSSCRGCRSRLSCGQHNRCSDGRFFRVECDSVVGARVGETVLLGVPESKLLQVSALVYLLPLAGMLLPVWLSGDGSELFSLVVALIGLLLGLFFSRQFARWNVSHRSVQLLGVFRQHPAPEKVRLLDPV